MLWAGFLALILACLAIDLGAFKHRHEHGEAMTLREATIWTFVWITVGLAFSGVIWFIYEHGIDGQTISTRTGEIANDGRQAALLYLTAFVLEKSLSIDNLFVIALVFQSFGVKPVYQHRVLFWGIVGAIIMRGVMIGGGLVLVEHFDWAFYLFGAYLVYQGVKLLVVDEEEASEREATWFERVTRRLLPVSDHLEGDRFTTRIDGKFHFTPLIICLVVVEATDVLFAFDSIPAVLAVSTEDFICYTSNIFAVLGLRSLYFVLAELMERFRYLKHSLSVILIFVGAKLVFHHYIAAHVPQSISIWASLGFITTALLGGIAWSWKKGGEATHAEHENEHSAS